MSIMQRASGFVYTVSSLFTIFLVFSLFTCPIVLYSGGNMVPFATVNQLRWLARFCFITMALNRINEFVVYLPSGYFVGQRDARGMMWMAPCKNSFVRYSISLLLMFETRSCTLCLPVIYSSHLARWQNCHLHLLRKSFVRT